MEKVLTFISDTHSKHNRLKADLPGGDILLHSGDMSSMGYEQELYDFLRWFSKQDYEHKIFIAGNHDFIFEKNPTLAKHLLDKFPNVTYLQDSGVDIDGLKIWGSPWQPAFFDWAFNLPRRGDELAQKWDLIPDDTNILLTHGPPYGILDLTNRYEKVGCERMIDKVIGLCGEDKLFIHAFGHIHSGYGYLNFNNGHFINASSLDERYDYSNKPVTLKINTNTKQIEIL